LKMWVNVKCFILTQLTLLPY